MTTDYFTYEIIKDALSAIGDEMFYALQRTSMSPIIYETLDYSVGVTDARGELIAQGNGVIGFLGTLDAAVREALKKFGETGDIHEGDVFITNDPYHGGGTHLSDVSLVLPVFFEGDLVAFVANKAHWTEVGGMNPGSFTTNSTEVFQEGLQFPNVKLFRRGVVNQSLLDILESNVRLPDLTLGDLWAGIAAIRVGERRLLELFGRYGKAALLGAIDSLLDYGETMVRAELRKLPKGTFEAEDHVDGDGLGNGPFPVRVKVTLTDDEFIVDFTGSHPQVAGPVNSTRTGLQSRVRAIFRAVVVPNIPTNGGMFRPLKVICPDGTLFTAERPAPTSTYWETGGMCIDLVWQALAPHVPERLPAGGFMSVCATILSGVHPDTGDASLLVEPLLGGWGAGHAKDGERGQFCQGNGETYNIPIEVTETRYGVRVDQYAFHTDDGGAGEFRGGNGVMLDYRITSDEAFLTGIFGRHTFRCWGVGAGQKGSPNYIKVLRKDGGEEIHGYTARLRLEKGDVVRLTTGTGGGYGDPRERPRDKVRADLRNGYITAEQASAHYGYDAAKEAAE